MILFFIEIQLFCFDFFTPNYPKEKNDVTHKGKKWGACLLGQNEANLKLFHINASVSLSYRKLSEKKMIKKNPTSWVWCSPEDFAKPYPPH